MRNLVLFIWKNYFFFLFILLELLSVSLLFKNNSFQRASFVTSSNAVSGSVLQTYAEVESYFNLRRSNELLALENARLRNIAPASFVDLTPGRITINDPNHRQKYEYIPARVVNNSTNRRNNYLTLNRGAKQGIKPEMAVIAGNGIVGIVKNVSDNFCSVMSLLHKDTRVSCKVKKEGSFGPLSWEGQDYRIATLTDIPTHVNIKLGDTIVTSAYSATFPEAILVGTVQKFYRKSGDPFYTLEVLLSADLKKVDHVYIVNNIMKDEQQALEKASQTDKDK